MVTKDEWSIIVRNLKKCFNNQAKITGEYKEIVTRNNITESEAKQIYKRF